MELSIDTSTNIAALGLSEEGVVKAETTWDAGMNHTIQLLPRIEEVLRLSGTDISGMTALFVGLGPGSFAGVRVALSVAKGLAFSLGIPLVGVCTLETEAYPFAWAGLPVLALHEAGRSELAVASYQETAGKWSCTRPPELTTIAALCAPLRSRTIFCGSFSSSLERELRSRLGEIAMIPAAAARLKRGGSLAALGWARFLEVGADDVAALQPIYLRRPHITVPKSGH